MKVRSPSWRQWLVAAPALVLLGIVVPPLFGGLGFEEWLHLTTGTLPLVALPGAIIFPLMYARSPWWRTHLGRAVMLMALSIGGLVLTPALRAARAWPDVASIYSGDPVPTDLMRAVIFLLLTVSIYYQVVALYLVTRRGLDLHTDDAEIRSHFDDELHDPHQGRSEADAPTS